MDFLDSDDNTSEEEFEAENRNQDITEVDATVQQKPENETKRKDETEQNEVIHKDAIVRYNSRPLSPAADTYELENFEKRLLFIFNHFEVFGCDPRVGTDRDVAALRKTFERLEFTVEEKPDFTKEQIMSELDALAEIDFTDYGCLAVAVLTHGDEEGQLRAKDKIYYESEIIERLKPNHNPTLLTKPKMLIVQACRGDLTASGLLVNNLEKVFKDHAGKKKDYSLPVEADMIVIHSSYIGQASHRTLRGSWLIQTLCRKIDELADTDDIDSILLQVKKAVAIDHGYAENNNHKLEISKQMPVITSTLIRKLYLRKYLTD